MVPKVEVVDEELRSTWQDPAPLKTAAESEEEFVIATSAAMKDQSVDKPFGRAIRPERFNSIEGPDIVVISSIVTLKVDPSQNCTCTLENAGETNESRNVIVNKVNARPMISIGRLGTLTL